MAVRVPSSVSDSGALIRLLVLSGLVIGAALLVSRQVTTARFEYSIAVAAGAAIFILAFLKTELALYLVIVSMLLSPEFGAGSAGVEHRQIVFRTEDFLLIVVAASWLAKTAVNKELGIVAKTPLNRPIFLYIATHAVATTFGLLTGTVRGASGYFYVLKYVEYFFVYFMVVNNVTTREQVRRLVFVAFATAAIASVIGIAQIPSGVRISAPFEGEGGEPNTFGGYLLFMMALALGLALETSHFRTRVWTVGALALYSIPFAFTLSRASYLGLGPMLLAAGLVSRRRQLMITVLVGLLVLSPFLVAVIPQAVSKRIAYTFKPEQGQPTVKLGRLALDPSTSVRLISIQQAFEGWQRRPILGWGVTGFGFMDAQYARTLVETGIVGFAAFLALLWAVLKGGLTAIRAATDGEHRGLAVGFVAGTVGLVVHALGSNTFIIVRIMEPFWLFAGIVVLLPVLEAPSGVTPSPQRRRAAVRDRS